MSTPIHSDLEDHYVSQAEAARMRAVTRQAISDLIRRGRLRGIRLAGRTLLLRSEVEDFKELARGRPFSNESKRSKVDPATRDTRHEHTHAS